jgi:hypothetical protein
VSKLTRWLLLLGVIFVFIGVGEFRFVHPAKSKEKPAPPQISDEFREVAGDAFDKVLALQAAELKGDLFYEPVLHEADLAIIKTKRKAGNDEERNLLVQISALEFSIEVYRSNTELFPLCHEHPDVCNPKQTIADLQAGKRKQKEGIEEITRLLKKPTGNAQVPTGAGLPAAIGLNISTAPPAVHRLWKR